MSSAQNLGVNFIPDEVLQEKSKISKKKYGNKLSTGLAIFSLILGISLYMYNRHKVASLLTMDSQIAEYEQTIDNLKSFGAKGYGLAIRLEQAKKVIEKSYEYSGLLVQMKKATPRNVTVSNYSVNLPDSISLTAVSFPNYTPIAEFQNNLLQKELFTSVKISSANLSGDLSSVNFGLTIVSNFDILREKIE